MVGERTVFHLPPTSMFLLCPAFFFVLFNFYSISIAQGVSWTTEKKLEYRSVIVHNAQSIAETFEIRSEATRELWNHGYNSYMRYGVIMHSPSNTVVNLAT